MKKNVEVTFTTSELDRLYGGLQAIQRQECSGSRDYAQEDEDEVIQKKLEALFRQASAKEAEEEKLEAEVMAEARKIVAKRREKR